MMRIARRKMYLSIFIISRVTATTQKRISNMLAKMYRNAIFKIRKLKLEVEF